MVVHDKKSETVKKQEIRERDVNKRVDWSVNRDFRDATAVHSNIYLSNIVSTYF
jgi:hypothetical protein